MLGGRKGPNAFAGVWIAGLAAVLISGCGSSSSSRNTHMLQSLGKSEGQLNLIEWPGYVEPQWVKPFEQQTGCQVHNKDA
jgi:putative spermidine/putrescine transport system substrate-binding protein